METNVPRISVVIITYKQEELIKRAIESLLSQREYIYEICVSDDCSPDHTWDVLQEYDKNYPGLFKLHRNEQNLGIFQNIEESWKLPTGDIVYQLAGDDACGEGWFKNVLGCIKENNIDWKHDCFGIFGNTKCIYPSGDILISRENKMVQKCNIHKGNTLLRFYLRGLLSGRTCCFGIQVLKKFQDVSVGRSYKVEIAQDSQLFIYLQNVYYLNYVGNIYYTKIGVSVTMSRADSIERMHMQEYAYAFLNKLGIEVIDKDKLLQQRDCAFLQFIHKKTVSSFIQYIRYSFLCFDRTTFFNSASLKLNIFRIIRRIPHKKPIIW